MSGTRNTRTISLEKSRGEAAKQDRGSGAKFPAVPREMFLLDRAKKRPERFAMLRPEVGASAQAVQQLAARATKATLWISYESTLTDALLKAVRGPARMLGNAVFIHPLDSPSIAALAGYFQRWAFISGKVDGFLPPDELAEALHASNAVDLFIGGSVDPRSETVTLWRGNLESLTVPFSVFETSGDGVEPDFSQFSVTDFGQTVRLGEYEAAADAILYDLDGDYRRRMAKLRQESERSLGASVRRLRGMRGLSRKDFEPEIAAKTIARIEQGKVKRIHDKTLKLLAERLQVKPAEIENF